MKTYLFSNSETTFDFEGESMEEAAYSLADLYREVHPDITSRIEGDKIFLKSEGFVENYGEDEIHFDIEEA